MKTPGYYFKKIAGVCLPVLAIVILCSGAGCKKSDNPGGTTAATLLFPAANKGGYWKLHYYMPGGTGDTNVVEYRIDSVFVSQDTVGLNIVDTNGVSPDTSRRTFTILKCYSRQKKYGQVEWVSTGPLNYGVFRIDPSNKRIHSVRTTCNCWPSIPQYPTPFFFYETTVFDYTVKTGDIAFIEHYYQTYKTTALVSDFYFNGYLLKKQTFTSNGETFKRTQLAGILNTIAFARVAVPNTIMDAQGFLMEMYYCDSPSDTLRLEPDFRFY